MSDDPVACEPKRISGRRFSLPEGTTGNMSVLAGYNKIPQIDPDVSWILKSNVFW